MKVSLHALSRYRERIETDGVGDDDEITSNILHAFKHSRPMRLRSARERISKLLKHGVETEYRQYNDQVLVVTGCSIVSVYVYSRDRWEAVK